MCIVGIEPTLCFEIEPKSTTLTTRSYTHLRGQKVDSNQKPADLESVALPIELF